MLYSYFFLGIISIERNAGNGTYDFYRDSNFKYYAGRLIRVHVANAYCALAEQWLAEWRQILYLLVYSQPLKNKYGKVRWSKACGTFQRNCYLTSVSNGFWRNRVTAFPLIRRHLNAMLWSFCLHWVGKDISPLRMN